MTRRKKADDRAVLDASLASLRAQGVPFRKLAEVKRRIGNPRENAEAVPEIVRSLLTYGWTSPMLVDPDGVLEAGDTRWLAAAHLGLEEVPVLRLDHDEKTAARYTVADNKLGEIATWSGPKLAAIFEGATPEEVIATGWTLEDLAALTGVTTPGDDDKPDDVDEDHDVDPNREPITKPGDVWILGEHRIVCGDSGLPEVVQVALAGKLPDLFESDPPYAIYGSSTGVASSISDDNMVVPFFERVARLAKTSVPWFGHVYVFCDWRSYPAVREGARRARLEPKNLLVWDKGGSGLGSNYANTHELIAFFTKMPAQTAMKSTAATGQRTVFKPNILRANRARGAERPHNASKPVSLVRELIENSTDKGARVFDPFLGGGSTLIACETSGRICHGIDIAPAWIDVCVARWERVTGKKAKRLPAGEIAAALPSAGAPPKRSPGYRRKAKVKK